MVAVTGIKLTPITSRKFGIHPTPVIFIFAHTIAGLQTFFLMLKRRVSDLKGSPATLDIV